MLQGSKYSCTLLASEILPMTGTAWTRSPLSDHGVGWAWRRRLRGVPELEWDGHYPCAMIACAPRSRVALHAPPAPSATIFSRSSNLMRATARHRAGRTRQSGRCSAARARAVRRRRVSAVCRGARSTIRHRIVCPRGRSRRAPRSCLGRARRQRSAVEELAGAEVSRIWRRFGLKLH